MENEKTKLQKLYEAARDEYSENYTDDMVTNYDQNPYAEYIQSYGYSEQKGDALKNARKVLDKTLNEWLRGKIWHTILTSDVAAVISNSITDLDVIESFLSVELNTSYRVNEDDILYVSWGEEEICLDEMNSVFCKKHGVSLSDEMLADYDYYPMDSYNTALRFDVSSYIDSQIEKITGEKV